MNNNNSEEKQSTQKRLIVVMLLSFTFFLAYDFLYIQPQYEQKHQTTTTVDGKVVSNSANDAPKVANVNTSEAPVTQAIPTSELVSTITTNRNIFKIDSLGRIAQVTLTEDRYIDDNNKQIDLFRAEQLRPLEVRFANRDINTEAFKTNVVASKSTVDARKGIQELVLTQTMSNTTVTKTLKFYPDGHYDIKVDVSNGAEFFITPGFRPDVLADYYADHGALLKMNDGTLTIIEDEDLERTENFTGIKIASAFDRYYATVLYNLDKSLAVSVMPDLNDSPQIFIHGKDSLSLSGYAGPKNYNVLDALNPELTDVIEYGWFTFIAKPMFTMLQFIQSYVGNWGWTIVLTTILIKLILFPLSHKGMVSMNRLKELSPKIKEIQEKYKDEPQKSGAKMMELYKKEGANPMGGCLPILLQIPVFFAIYRVLINAIELKGAEWFLFFDDLTHTIVFPNLLDPYIILPLFMGLTMYIQQLITPTQIQDEMQKKIFQMLPVMFTIFFIFFPAGLVLYWTINNIFTISHQYYINRTFEKAKIERHQEHLNQKKKK